MTFEFYPSSLTEHRSNSLKPKKGFKHQNHSLTLHLSSQNHDADNSTTRSHKKQLRGPGSGQRVLQNEDHRVASEEHLGDEPVLVDRLGLLLALWIKDESTFEAISRSPTFASLRQLSPHLLHALQHHVAVSIESFHSP